jgi:hypothetical protein
MAKIVEQRSNDWLNSADIKLLAWWLPKGAIIAALFVAVPLRAAVWTVALLLDGDRVHFKCTALWAHSLPLYRPLLLGDEYSGACSGLQPNLRKHLCMARTCPPHSLWWLAYLVGDLNSYGAGTRTPDVRFWPLADIPSCIAHVRFWG